MRRQKGFTLIELLIVIAIIGIIAAIAIPNLLNALDRSRQKRSMSDIRTWGTAIGTYLVDANFYFVTAADPLTTTSEIYVFFTTKKYLENPPVQDGWNNAFAYLPQGTTFADMMGYTFLSKGKGNNNEGVVVSTHRFKCFSCDIMHSNGQFIHYPEGPQQDSPQTNTCVNSAPCI